MPYLDTRCRLLPAPIALALLAATGCAPTPVEPSPGEGSRSREAAVCSGNTVYEAGYYKTPQTIYDAALEGNLLFAVAASTLSYPNPAWNGLEVYDLTDPKAPKAIGAIPVLGWTGKKNVAGQPIAVAVDGKTAVAAGPGNASDGSTTSDYLWTVDVQNPAKPVVHGAEYLASSYDVRSVALHGEYAYVSGDHGVRVVYVGDLADPRLVKTIDPPAAPFAAVAEGDALFVGTASGLVVYDIANPLAPVQLAKVGSFPATHLAVEGDLAYVVEAQPQGDAPHALRIFDIANPSAPVAVGSTSLPWAPEHIAVRGDFAYVAGGGGGQSTLEIDVSDPSQPAVLGGVFVSYDSRRVVAAGQLLVSVVYNENYEHDGFNVYSLTCPDVPSSSGGGGGCAHASCSKGVQLESTCDPCVAAICDDDAYCCNTSWDSLCVSHVPAICNQTCN